MAEEKNLLEQMWDASAPTMERIGSIDLEKDKVSASFLKEESEPVGLKKEDFSESIGENIDQDKFFEGIIEGDEKKEVPIKDNESKQEEKPAPQKVNSKNSPIPYSLTFEALVEQDILSSFDKEEFERISKEQGDAMALTTTFQREFEYIKEQVRNEVEEDKRLFMKLMDKGLTPQESSDITQLKTKYASLKDDDIIGDDNESKREDLLKVYYTVVKGFSKEEAEEEVENIKALGKDEQRSKKVLPEINKYIDDTIQYKVNQKKQEEQQRIEGQKQVIESYKKEISSTDEYVPGQKINKQTKDKIEDLIFSEKIFQKVIESPAKYWSRIAYLETIGFFEGKGTEKLTSAAKKTAMDELSSALKRGGGNNDLKPNMTRDADENDDFAFDQGLAKSKKNRQ